MIVLDTHVLIWNIFFPDKLTKEAKNIILNELDAEGTLYYSSISIWEIGIKFKKKHIIFPAPFNEFITMLDETKDFVEIPTDKDIYLKAAMFDWEHKDPADRIIVATALVNDATLVTADEVLHDRYSKCVWK